MEIHRSSIHCQTTGDTDVVDITPQVTEALRNAGIGEGVVFLFISGSTAALTTIEYEQGVVNDLVRTIEKIAPKNISYEHNLRWGDGNGYSHVRASFLGPSHIVWYCTNLDHMEGDQFEKIAAFLDKCPVTIICRGEEHSAYFYNMFGTKPIVADDKLTGQHLRNILEQ